MGIFKLQHEHDSATSEADLNGREYFREAEREYGTEDFEGPELETPSEVGGDLSHHDTEELDDAETSERGRLSEEFLKQPPVHFPAEDDPK